MLDNKNNDNNDNKNSSRRYITNLPISLTRLDFQKYVRSGPA